MKNLGARWDASSARTRKIPKVAAVFLAIALLLAVLSVVLATRSPLVTPPLAYSQSVYQAEPTAVVHSGDVLHWVSHLRVTRPSVVWRYRTIWSLDDRRTVWSDQVVTYAIWTAPVDDVTSNIDFTLPNVAPGRYVIRVAGQGEGSPTAIYEVFVHVIAPGGAR